jgi:N-acetylmuramoyl-L-alanine amidase
VLADRVRVTAVFDREVGYRTERIEQPARVFFDFAATVPTPELQHAQMTYPEAVVRHIRVGQHPGPTTRLVLDIEGVIDYSIIEMLNPFRLLIECRRRPVEPSPGDKALGQRATAPVGTTAADTGERTEERRPDKTEAVTGTTVAAQVAPAPVTPTANIKGGFSLSRQLGLGISRVVIDAGHGGHDPGAKSGNLSESQIVLDVALRLEKLLLAEPGIEVIMTRRTDKFIHLEERTAIANREGADLFLSIHANASRNRMANGVETYVLNFASNPEAEAVAARENSASASRMNSLPDIVRAIALNNKLDESRDFASMIQRAMVERLRPVNKPLRDLGVKQAPFVVLIGAEMPSVLVEISFLSNRQEGRLLGTPAYRQRIAEALFDGIRGYQRGLKNPHTVSYQ